MKFIKFIASAIIALIIFSACSSNDNAIASNPLVGTWVSVYTKESCSYVTYTFNSDMSGTFQETDLETGEIDENNNFTYVYDIDANKGVISFDDGPEYDTYVELIDKITIKLTYASDDEIDMLEKKL